MEEVEEAEYENSLPLTFYFILPDIYEGGRIDDVRGEVEDHRWLLVDVVRLVW